MSVYLVYPVLVAKAAGLSSEAAAAMVSMTLIVLAVATILQAIPFGPIGSGYLCQPIPSIVYFVPSMVALNVWGVAVRCACSAC